MNAAELFKQQTPDVKPQIKSKTINYWSILKPPYKTKDLLTIGISFLLFLTIPLTVFLTSQSRDYRSKASESIGPPDKSVSYNMPVLVLKYFPTQDGINLDSSVTGITSTLANIRTKVDRITTETEAALQSGSIYRGYKDNTATPALNYSIYDSKEYLQTLPVGLP